MTSPITDVLAEYFVGVARTKEYQLPKMSHGLLAILAAHGYRIVAVPDGSAIEHGDRLDVAADAWAYKDGLKCWLHPNRNVGTPANNPCLSCGGKGELYGSFIKRSGEETNVLRCPDCAGTGRVPDKRGE